MAQSDEIRTASRPVSETAVGMAKTPKAVEISKMIAEFIMNLLDNFSFSNRISN